MCRRDETYFSRVCGVQIYVTHLFFTFIDFFGFLTAFLNNLSCVIVLSSLCSDTPRGRTRNVESELERVELITGRNLPLPLHVVQLIVTVCSHFIYSVATLAPDEG